MPSQDSISARMAATRGRDNPLEMAVRRGLRARGLLGYRVAHRIPGMRRRTCDIAFPGRRLAVFLDGCFWHRCPQHASDPRSNSDYWTPKLLRNVERDAETSRHLEQLGWTVLRFWEHEGIDSIVDRIATAAGVPGLVGSEVD